MADDNKKELLNILKINKDNGKSFNTGFTSLNKSIVSSIKTNISVGKAITSALGSLGTSMGYMSKEMSKGFIGMVDAEKKALSYQKTSDTGDKLDEGEKLREPKKKSFLSDLPKGKDLIDPKKWGMFAKSFVFALFGMLKGLLVSILLPLAMGLMTGYYKTLAKVFSPIVRGIKNLFGRIGKSLLGLGKILGKLGLKGLIAAGDVIRDAAKALTDTISKKFGAIIKNMKNFFALKIWDMKFAFENSKVGMFFKRIKAWFSSKIFDMNFRWAAWLDDFGKSPVGKFINRIKSFFSLSIFGNVDDIAKGVPGSLGESKIGQFLAKVKGFFNLPFFTKAADMFKIGFSFAETGIGKLITKIKGFLGIGVDAAKFGGGILGDLGDMGKGLANSSVGKFFTKIKNFFGMGKEPGPFTNLIKTFQKVFAFELPPGIAKTMGAIGKVFGKVFAVFGIFMGIYEAVKAFTGTEGTVGEKIVAALKAFIDEVIFGLPNFLIEMVGKGVSALLDFLGFGDASKAVADATKDFSIMDLISDNIGKFWTWIKGFFSDLFNFEGLSLDALIPSFDFDIGNPLKLVGEKLAAVFKGFADFTRGTFGAGWFTELMDGAGDKVAAWGGDDGGKVKKRSGGIIQQVTGEQVPAILHANEIVLAESSAKLFLQAAQMFADPKYTNAMKDMVKANANIKTQTTDAIMQAGAQGGGDGGTAQMMAALMQQTSTISQTMAQIPGAVQEGASSGAFTGTQSSGFSKLSNPHEQSKK